MADSDRQPQLQTFSGSSTRQKSMMHNNKSTNLGVNDVLLRRADPLAGSRQKALLSATGQTSKRIHEMAATSKQSQFESWPARVHCSEARDATTTTSRQARVRPATSKPENYATGTGREKRTATSHQSQRNE
jgi:hypothetical protein